jgi:DNA polymerase III subunit epsilon
VKNGIVLDTETNGLDPAKCQILEIAIVDLRSGSPLLHSYVNPGVPIPPEITAINHITDEMVAGAPSWAEVAEQICGLISSAEAVIGYNVAFDRGMIDGEMNRLGRAIAWPILICSLRVWDVNEPRERRLMSAYKRFVDRAGFEDAHSAMADTQATRTLFLAQEKVFGLEETAWDDIDPERKLWFGPSHHIVWSSPEKTELRLGFGKNTGKSVLSVERSFFTWMRERDFADHVLMVAIKALDHYGQPEQFLAWARKYERGLPVSVKGTQL